MKDFEYIQPDSIATATELLAEGDAAWSNVSRRAIAGGQDLFGELKTGIVEVDSLVDLKATGADNTIAVDPSGNLRIGALVKLTDVAELAERGPVASLLAAAALSVASPQIRSQATLGGNLCQRPRCLYYRRPEAICLKKGGDECFAYGGHNKYNAILGGGPSFIVHPSDLAPALVALDAKVTIAGAGGATRELPLADLYTLPSEGDVTRETVLTPSEVLTQVETQLPLVDRMAGTWRSSWQKFRERDGFDFALSAVAMCLRVADRRIVDARVVLGGVAPRPWRSAEAEAALIGQELATHGSAEFDALAVAAGEAALTGAEPLDHNGYKIPLTKGLVRRALQELSR
ncbi:MAG: FAD binding domain-containing protein [Planctomycetota bacterium]|nr:FAD binding domain-containing protein [Planctomycetota bacterium]